MRSSLVELVKGIGLIQGQFGLWGGVNINEDIQDRRQDHHSNAVLHPEHKAECRWRYYDINAVLHPEHKAEYRRRQDHNTNAVFHPEHKAEYRRQDHNTNTVLHPAKHEWQARVSEAFPNVVSIPEEEKLARTVVLLGFLIVAAWQRGVSVQELQQLELQVVLAENGCWEPRVVLGSERPLRINALT